MHNAITIAEMAKKFEATHNALPYKVAISEAIFDTIDGPVFGTDGELKKLHYIRDNGEDGILQLRRRAVRTPPVPDDVVYISATIHTQYAIGATDES